MKKGTKVFWFTGLSGAGKTTVANIVTPLLEELKFKVLVLDGDEVRKKYRSTQNFSKEAIVLNNQLILDMCVRNMNTFHVILVPIISPYRSSREKSRIKLKDAFHEIYFSDNLNTVSKRDIKGLYKKAREGKLKNMIGFSPGSPYEPPENPDLIINSVVDHSPKESAERLFNFINNVFN